MLGNTPASHDYVRHLPCILPWLLSCFEEISAEILGKLSANGLI